MAVEDSHYTPQPFTQDEALMEALLRIQNGLGSQQIAFGTNGMSLSLTVNGEGHICGLEFYQNGAPIEPQSMSEGLIISTGKTRKQLNS